MIGKHQLVIGPEDFVKGMSTSDNIQDGGFSPKVTVGGVEVGKVNLIANPGVLYGPATIVDSDTDNRLTGEIIGSTPDHNVLAGDNRLLFSDNDTFYRYDGTKIIAAAYTGGTASTFAEGFSDIINFAGETYVTAKERIKRWTSTSTIADLVSFTNTTYPHPAIVFENNAFYGDKNLLLRQTAAAGTPATILTLSLDQVIIALGIDPSTGYMLISTTSSLNISDTLPAVNKVLWYDGFSGKPIKSMIVDEMVLSFHPVGGTVYVGYGLNLGYLTGSGIQFLRRLYNAGRVQDELPYKHHLCSIGNTLYVVDKNQILAFGEVLPGKKVWYHAWESGTNNPDIRAIFPAGSDKLGISYETNEFATMDVKATTAGGLLRFATNRYEFPRPVYIRKAFIEYVDAVADANNTRNLYYSSDGFASEVEMAIEGNTTATLKNETGATLLTIDNIIGVAEKTRTAQFRYYHSTTNYGVKRIIIYYDFAE